MVGLDLAQGGFQAALARPHLIDDGLPCFAFGHGQLRDRRRVATFENGRAEQKLLVEAFQLEPGDL